MPRVVVRAIDGRVINAPVSVRASAWLGRARPVAMWLARKRAAVADGEGQGVRKQQRVLQRRHTPLCAPVEGLRAASFQVGGRFLYDFAHRGIAVAVRQVGRPAGSLRLRVASVCTGTQ
jgi:hypothetical protein